MVLEVRNFGPEAVYRCENSQGFKEAYESMPQKAQQACKGNDPEGLFFVAKGLTNEPYVASLKAEANYYSCPSFIHSTKEIGSRCPEGYSIDRHFKVNGLPAVECVTVISGAVHGKYFSEYCSVSADSEL